MECNRDEALRARELAVRMFLRKDIKGAKKFALKAQNLYSELEGISQMVRTLDVYVSADEGKVQGESNWYAVLGVTRLADDETIRKQYRKLALLLHPDKNRSVGAEGAFYLISQAWSLLSDKSKRIAYDQRCDSTFQQRVQTNNGGLSKPPKQNGFHNSSKTSNSKMKASNSKVKTSKGNSGERDASSGPYLVSKKELPTFWTVCHRCKVQYEYLRMYLNRNLLCPNCNEAYFAIEIERPSTKACKTSQTKNPQNWKNSSQQESNSQWAPFSGSRGTASAVHAANMVKQAYDKVKRQRQKVQAATKRDEGMHGSDGPNAVKRRKVVEDSFGTQRETTNGVNSGSGVGYKEKILGHKENCLRCTNKHDGECQDHLKQLLMEKAREEVRRKLNENLLATLVKNKKDETVDEDIKDDEKIDIIDTKTSCGVKCNQENTSGPNRDIEQVEQMLVNVPDSEFSDFDKDKIGICFAENQVWAVYDDDDGMPRHYVMIHDVISLNPFKVRMSWLNSTTNSRIGHGSWFRGGFSKTCGEFGRGRVQIYDSADSFSHNVRWRKCTTKIIQIFPMKGDVWALYRNWSAEWNELTEDDMIYKYEMAEVLEDYNEEFGVLVVPLIKVAGSKAIFHKHSDPKEVQRIPREEMSRFSHQVPSLVLTGQEGSKYPKGCRELDPAATPLEILEAISEIEEIEFMEADFGKPVDCENLNVGDRESKVKSISSTAERYYRFPC